MKLEIGNIIKGTLNEVFELNKDIKTKRLEICYDCPLYLNKYGGVCNNRLWLNLETGDISLIQKTGYKNGCGCRLQSKTTLPDAKCPLDKW